MNLPMKCSNKSREFLSKRLLIGILFRSNKFTFLQFKATDAGELPKNICKNCELSLNLAFQFRSKALKSQRIIETFCNHKHFKDVAIENTEDSFKTLKNEYDLSAEVKQEDATLDLDEVVEDEVEEHLMSPNERKIEDLELPFPDDAKIEFLDNEDFDEYDATCRYYWLKYIKDQI